MKETPEEFAQKIENAIVHKYIESPNGRGGVIVISKDYIPAGKIIAERDAAIRAESAALLKMCGEALGDISQLRGEYAEAEDPSAKGFFHMACDKADTALAALEEAGVRI